MKNKNRGFKQLRLWQDSVSLCLLAFKVLSKSPFELEKVAADSIGGAHIISSNIPEGRGQTPMRMAVVLHFATILNVSLMDSYFNVLLVIKTKVEHSVALRGNWVNGKVE